MVATRAFYLFQKARFCPLRTMVTAKGPSQGPHHVGGRLSLQYIGASHNSSANGSRGESGRAWYHPL